MAGDVLKRTGFENVGAVGVDLIQQGQLVGVGDGLAQFRHHVVVLFHSPHDRVGGFLGGLDDGIQLVGHAVEMQRFVGRPVDGGDFLAHPLDIFRKAEKLLFRRSA